MLDTMKSYEICIMGIKQSAQQFKRGESFTKTLLWIKWGVGRALLKL